jgi:hypothetical protein
MAACIQPAWPRVSTPEDAIMREKDLPPSVDRVRIETDQGVMGDKVAHPDPAAAPLGTDAEAGGAAPTWEERVIAARRPKRAVAQEDRPAPGGGAVLSLKMALALGALMLIIGALFVSLRLRQFG